MITGTVNADLEAVIQVVVIGTNRQQQVDAVIDTGFSGYLSLPLSIVTALGLIWLGRQPGVLADGAVHYFDVYRADVNWDGQMRTLEVEAVNAAPLIGMSLLHGHELQVQVRDGGSVTVAPIP